MVEARWWKVGFIARSTPPVAWEHQVPEEVLPHVGWRGSVGRAVGVEQNQQRLSGQSRERDPGLLTPALSLDLHSNRHQGSRAKGRLSWLPAGGRGICFCTSFAQERTLGWALEPGKGDFEWSCLQQERPGPPTNKGNSGPTLLGECDQVTEPESAVSGLRHRRVHKASPSSKELLATPMVIP